MATLWQGVPALPLAEIDSVKVKGGGTLHWFALAPGKHDFKSKPIVVKDLIAIERHNPDPKNNRKVLFVTYSGAFDADPGGMYVIDMTGMVILKTGPTRLSPQTKVGSLSKTYTLSPRLP
jgi:hypothetical protein